MDNGAIKVTVFTPTYNRGDLITNSFQSLLSQTCKDFEWIIIDDGQDNTDILAEKYKESSDFPIKYYRNSNSNNRGIGRAFNQMLDEAKGLVLKLDDDDTLTPNAIEEIIKYEKTIDKKVNYAGVGGLRQYSDGRAIGNEWMHDSEWFDCTNLERSKYGLNGDKAEAYYLSILKEYGPMPTVTGENYTWEGILWDRIAHAGKKIRWFNKKIYTTEYLPGGATDTRLIGRENSFFTYTIYVSEHLGYSEVPLISRMKLSCRYFELLNKKNIPFNRVKKYFKSYGGFVEDAINEDKMI